MHVERRNISLGEKIQKGEKTAIMVLENKLNNGGLYSTAVQICLELQD